MPHSNTRIWIHLVFSTKERIPLITDSFEKKLYSHIERKLSFEFDCIPEAINGMGEHIHAFFRMSGKHSLENIVKNLKGESSHWINQNGFLRERFAWQTGYCAFSISVDKVEVVKKYVRNQKKHHEKKSFLEEYKEFMRIYGIKEDIEEI
ncbi:MAG: IS200/IS605 family transposase [Bacteroidetes bacterium]|nr:IS200/IS605 family transposase [Bacteroidota bacterium]